MVLGSDAAACDDSSTTSSYSSNWKLASITLIVQSNPEIDGVDISERNLIYARKGFLPIRITAHFNGLKYPFEHCLEWYFL